VYRIRRFLFVLLLLLGWPSASLFPAQQAEREIKTVALTFEKLPAMRPLGFWTPREISNQILRVLTAEGIQAIGFVVQEKIDDDPGSLVVLDDWLKKGQLLGNNTYAYVDLNELSARDFLEHAADGQESIRKLSRPSRIPYRYFRFPMLHEGNTKSKKKDVFKALDRNGYQIIPATVIPADFEFNHVFIQAEEKEQWMEPLRKLYREHFTACLDYSEKQAEQVFGGPIPQIVRLHVGVATAAFLGDVLELLKTRGYQFVTVKEAMSDPAYQAEEDYVGPLGLSFIDRVAATQGKDYDPEACDISRTRIRRRLGIR